MIGLRSVHALGVFPSDIAEKTEDRDDESHEPEYGGSKKTRDDSVVFGGEVKHRSDGAVDRNEGEPDDKTAWDGKEGPFGPEVGDEGCLAEDSDKNGSVECSTPDPMTGDSTIALR